MTNNVKIYETAKISPRTTIVGDESNFIGDFCFIACVELHMAYGAQVNRFVEISGRGRVDLGKYATVGSHVSILTSTDTPWGHMNDNAPDSERRIMTRDIEICDDAFIGQHSTIMPGVTVGERSVVGAYSFVTRDIPPDVIVVPKRERWQMQPRKWNIPGSNMRKRAVPDMYMYSYENEWEEER